MADHSFNIPYGYCQCGCGHLAPIAKTTRSSAGWIKGQPMKFIRGHQGYGRPAPRGNKCAKWKGGKRIDVGGYISIYNPCHHRAGSGGYVFEHILVAEKILGRYITDKEVVHHIDGNKYNNDPDNIYVFCTLSAHNKYHQDLHAFEICGHWGWRKCKKCKKYDSPSNLMKVGKHCRHEPICRK